MAELDTPLLDSVVVPILNGGNTDVYPVFLIDGPFTVFLLSNLTTGLAISYDESLPGGVPVGGGDYAEIIMFRNTCYLNGNLSNLKPSIDPTFSDFFPLVPGLNDIICTGAGGLCKSWDAWA